MAFLKWRDFKIKWHNKSDKSAHVKKKILYEVCLLNKVLQFMSGRNFRSKIHVKNPRLNFLLHPWFLENFQQKQSFSKIAIFC